MTITIDLRFLAFAFLLCAFVVALLITAMRKNQTTPKAAARDLFDREVYRDQVKEIEEDLAQGRIEEEEAAALRLEIERRLLRTDKNTAPAAPGKQAAEGMRFLTLAVIAFVPLAAILIYAFLGSPGLPGQPFSGRNDERAAAAQQEAAGGVDTGMIESMVGRLAGKLEENPDDPQGWKMLARSYLVLNRPEEAEAALAEAIRLFPENTEFLFQKAHLLITLATPEEASFPVVPEEAAKILSKLLELDPDYPDALWFGGIFEAQNGNKTAAIRMWKHLLSILPEDNEVRPSLENLITGLEEDDQEE